MLALEFLMNRYQSFFPIAAALAIVAPMTTTALAQQDEQALAVLKESIAAIKAMNGVQFDVKRDTEIAGGLKMGGVANLKFLRSSSGLAHTPGTIQSPAITVLNFQAKGRTEVPVDGVRVFHVALVDGKTVYVLDEAAKTLFQRPMAPRVEGEKPINQVRSILMPPAFAETDPFTRELRAVKIVKEELMEYGGEPCDVIRCTFDNNTSESLIAISVADRLPRFIQVSRAVGSVGKENARVGQTWEISNLKLMPDMKAEDLVIKAPDGFKMDKQDVAPPAQAPASKPSPTEPAVVAGGLAVGTAIPTFELKMAGGGGLSNKDIANSVAVFGFWNSKTPASNAMARVVEAVAGQVDAKKVKFYGVAWRGTDEAAAQKWIADNKLTFGTAIGGDAMAQSFNVRGSPSVVVVNAEGKVSAFIEGSPTDTDVKAAIDNAIAGK